MIWYLIYFGIVFVLLIILWINKLKDGELLENKKYRIFAYFILIPFYLTFIYKFAEYSVDYLRIFVHKQDFNTKIILENNSKDENSKFTFFVRNAKFEHWKPIAPNNNFSLDLDAYSYFESIPSDSVREFDFTIDTSKYSRILTVKLEKDYTFKYKQMQAILTPIMSHPVKLFNSDFELNYVNTIKPNLNYQIMLLSLFFVTIIGLIYNFFIEFERLIIRLLFIFINLVFLIISILMCYNLLKYFLLYI